MSFFTKFISFANLFYINIRIIRFYFIYNGIDFRIHIVANINFDNWNINSNDIDDDSICNNLDNCPEDYNPNQEDFNFDETGDACDGIGLYETIKNKNLIKTIDVLGRDTNSTGLNIEIYDDGSTEKKIVIE